MTEGGGGMGQHTENELRFIRVVEDLRRSPRLDAECDDPETVPLDSGDRSSWVADWAAGHIDQQMAACALRFTTWGARWRTVGRRTARFQGDFSLIGMRHVVDQGPPEPTTSFPTQFQAEFFSQLRIFDHTPRSGSGKLSYIRFPSGGGGHEIWYSALADIGSNPYPPGFVRLELTYCEYLDALLLAKGTFGWQYLYADVPLRRGDFHEIAAGLRGMVDLFPELFPDHDYSDLRARLEARL